MILNKGPVIGPIAGGYIAQTMGIKYTFITFTGHPLPVFIFRARLDYPFTRVGLCGVASIIGIPLLKETYAPVIRLRRAQKSGDLEALARIPDIAHVQRDKWKFLWDNLTRPFIMLTRSFICFILSLYMAL